MINDAPKLGEYVKFNRTGEIFKLNSYDPKSQMLEIELPVGAIIIVPRHEVDAITANEEVEYLSKKKKSY